VCSSDLKRSEGELLHLCDLELGVFGRSRSLADPVLLASSPLVLP
jgi:hypothetical protein